MQSDSVLVEVTRVRQVPGEARRRWFFSHEQDLMIWLDEDNRPVAFQLAYGKYRNERAIRWKAGEGFTHYDVDDGEGVAGANDTPLLSVGGAFPARQVLDRFVALSAEVPRELVQFVLARLREHPGYDGYPRHRSRVSASGAALALGLSLIALALLVAGFRRTRSTSRRRSPE